MGAPAARAAELAARWAQAGHHVSVLTGFPNHPTGVVASAYRSQLRRLVVREPKNGVEVLRTWLWPLPNRKPHERILNYTSFAGSAALTGTFLSQPDVVIATSPQLLVGLAGYWIAKAKRVPFVFEVRDLWPESLAAVGLGQQHSWMNRSLGTIADFLYRRADHIVVVTPAFRQHLATHWNIPSERISVVENGVECSLFQPMRRDLEFAQSLGLEGKFVVGYIGTIGMAHGLETLVETATRLQRIAPEIVFLVIGEGAEKQNLISSIRARGLTNLVFLDQQSREKIPSYISLCDTCLVLLKKSDVFRTVIPTKMLEFMSCARAVILGVEGQAQQIIEEARAGLCIPPESPDSLAEAILKMRDDGKLRGEMGLNGRRYIISHYSREQTAARYISVLEQLLGLAARPAAA